ncbi:MAG: hypothetical protein ABR562_02015 [Thermoplasmatota archaeon]|nr:hypothetical protein [Halobacteriales archaeon]
MNNARLALMATGMAFILIAVGILYYQTDLRKNIPEGAAIALLVALAGLFVIGISTEFRRDRRVHEHVEHMERVGRPPRPARVVETTVESAPRYGDYEEHRIETIERRD